MKHTKVMRYQIIKPVEDSWETLGNVLRHVQRETRQALNRTIQLCWEYQGFSAKYKEEHGSYPSKKDILEYSSEHGYAYNVLKNECKSIGTANLSQSIKRACDKWKSDLKDVLRGDRSIPTYKKDCPLDVVKQAISIEKVENDYIVSLSLISKAYYKELGRKNGMFRILVKSGDKSQQDILNRLIEGTYNLGASQLIYRNKKWFINVTYQFETQEKAVSLNKDYVMGIDLGWVNPLYIAFNHSLARYAVSGNEIEAFRKQVEQRKKSLQHQGKYCGEGRRGHGSRTRVRPVTNIEDKIAKFRDTCNHKYARFVIDTAIKHRCGTIQMEELEGISNESTFLKRWSYYDLQQKIEYKAKEAGIEVIKVNPQYTSQRCSKCGHIQRENRSDQATFQCMKCDFSAHADFNAARNIATPFIDTIIKKDLAEQVIEN